MMKVHILGETPYGDAICRYFQQVFPGIAEQSKASLLDTISQILVGTKETRYGSLPSPESLVAIRAVINTAIERSEPIPILMPWGGRKPVTGMSLDVAEIVAITNVLKANSAIRQIYNPGIAVNIRVEDLGALWLYRSEKQTPDVTTYTSDFDTLLRIISPEGTLTAYKESDLCDWKDYFDIGADFSSFISSYLQATDEETGIVQLGKGNSFEALVKMGWKGEISYEMRNHYYSMYERLEPGISKIGKINKLADYLGGSAARVKLGAKAAPKTDYGYIQLSYTPPVPGVPPGLFDTTVYWRTIPLSQGKTHIAPWRAKGYITTNGATTKAKVTSFNNSEVIQQLEEAFVILSDDKNELKVRADYMIEEAWYTVV